MDLAGEFLVGNILHKTTISCIELTELFVVYIKSHYL